jgi:hypothetical protein
MLPKSLVPETFKSAVNDSNNYQHPRCEPPLEGKLEQTRFPHPTSEDPATQPLEAIHTDFAMFQW